MKFMFVIWKYTPKNYSSNVEINTHTRKHIAVKTKYELENIKKKFC